MNTKLIYLLPLTFTLFFSSCKRLGCTEETAINFDEKAKKDDNSCIYPVEKNGDETMTAALKGSWSVYSFSLGGPEIMGYSLEQMTFTFVPENLNSGIVDIDKVYTTGNTNTEETGFSVFDNGDKVTLFQKSFKISMTGDSLILDYIDPWGMNTETYKLTR